MIQGVVTPDREAVIHLTARGPQGDEAEIDAVIDTGFNDYLTLSPALITSLRLPFAAPTQATLADGSVVAMRFYRASVIWDGIVRDVLALSADGGPLIGMSMLYGHDLYMEAVDGGAVTITPRGGP